MIFKEGSVEDNTMKLYYILGLSLVMAVLAVATTFKDCGSKGAKVNSVTIAPCKSEPCTVDYHSHFKFEIPLTTLENVTHLTYKPYVSVSDRLIPFKSGDGCRLIGCPIVAGRNFTATFYVKFSTVIPDTNFDLFWVVLDDQLQPFFCIDIPFKMKSGRESLLSRTLSMEPDFDPFGEMSQDRSFEILRI